MRFSVMCLSLCCSVLSADVTSLELISEQGDRLSVQQLSSGETWGSFFLNDHTLAKFDLHELVILQVDNHKPVKLEQGMRSCGAPAGKTQQIDYVFTQQDKQQEGWQFETSQSSQPVLKLLGWDKEQYDSVTADLREVVIDFPVREPWFYQQVMSASQFSFRYMTTDGKTLQTIFTVE